MRLNQEHWGFDGASQVPPADRINGHNRLFLVAIRQSGFAPLRLGQRILERMQLMLCDPRSLDVESDEPIIGPLPDWKPPRSAGQGPPPRLVRGEVLRDEAGRLYEKIGDRLHALQRVAAGPRGEILDLGPGPSNEATLSHSPEPQSAHQAGQTEIVPSQPPFRPLFPDPGVGRIVRFGDVQDLLTGQLLHPDRLRDAHRLACHVQVYEALATHSLEALGRTLAAAGGAARLQRLTAPLAEKLELVMLMHNRRAEPDAPGQPDVLQPGTLVCRIQAAQDPTADGQVRAASPDCKAPIHESRREGGSESSAAGPRKSIPERYVKPWEFHLGREEVLYDMNVAMLFRGALARLFAWLKSCLTGRSALRKWQTLLYGRTLDEQLWTVRPPKGNVGHPAVQAWAKKTLELAGYEPQTMLLEWEIFWRRKGR
jgi:hypothetical protein